MNLVPLFIGGAIAATVALAVLAPVATRAEQAPGLDRRLLFDPTPLDQGMARGPRVSPRRSADQSTAAVNAQRWRPTPFFVPGLNYGRSGKDNTSLAAILGRFGDERLGAADGATLRAPRSVPDAFLLGIETDRANVRRLTGEEATSDQDRPFGQKPRRRFVPFIGLSARTPITEE